MRIWNRSSCGLALQDALPICQLRGLGIRQPTRVERITGHVSTPPQAPDHNRCHARSAFQGILPFGMALDLCRGERANREDGAPLLASIQDAAAYQSLPHPLATQGIRDFRVVDDV